VGSSTKHYTFASIGKKTAAKTAAKVPRVSQKPKPSLRIAEQF
jgi:uroporphyrinogen-III synthase